MLRPAAEVSQGDWLLRYSAIEPLVVESYVSAGFPAYARVLNPANGFDGAAVRWSVIAQEIGVELTAQTQWSDLAAEFQDEDELINLDAPDWSPDPAVARALTSVLRSHTGSAQDCYFLIWEGYASVSDYVFGLDAPKVAVSQHRSLFLLNGSLQDACEPFIENDGRLPNWWWPATSLRPKWTECKLKRGLGRLGRIARSPRISPKSPPRFDGRCEGCLADSNLTRTIAVRPGASSAASYPRAQHWRPGQIRSVAFAGGCRADLRGVAPSCSAGTTSCAAGLGRSVASKPPRGRALQKGPAARTDRQRIMINGLRSGRRRRILREHNGGQFGSINRTPSGAV